MSVTSTYGANIAFIEELYEKYRSNPEAVSATWREFFRDYEPQFAEDLEEEIPIAANAPARPIPVPSPPTPPPAPAGRGETLARVEAPLPAARGEGGQRPG